MRVLCTSVVNWLPDQTDLGLHCHNRYLIGTDLIHKLRTDLAAAYGESFCLRQFHDEFLSYGSIPVKLISDEMRR
eukprot:COSAG02_NODE_35398_length_469_cov_0.678378_2_plen_74_part_01